MVDSLSTTEKEKASIWNVPNQLTIGRLVLAIVCFVLISLQVYGAAFVVFLVAVSTDWIDGYWARKYNQVTKLGRILDPFVDKIIICGTFIFLCAEPQSGITAWFAVIVVGREILVTALRGFIEQQGGDFSARALGKWKMEFQCVAVSTSLVVLMGIAGPDAGWLDWTLLVAVWLAVLFTIYSGVDYIGAAIKMVRN